MQDNCGIWGVLMISSEKENEKQISEPIRRQTRANPLVAPYHWLSAD